jgi:hypothetical protein
MAHGAIMTQSFFVPGPIPGMNDYIGKGQRWCYTTDKKKWSQVIAFHIRHAKVQPVGPVYVHFLWREKNRRRNPDNFAAIGKKFCLDALQQCGILKNDGWAEIIGWSDTWVIDREKPGVLITLEET